MRQPTGADLEPLVAEFARTLAALDAGPQA